MRCSGTNGDQDAPRQKDDLRLLISNGSSPLQLRTVQSKGIRSEIPLVSNADVEMEIASPDRGTGFFYLPYPRSALY
jgi:hypothetical protein